MLRHLTLSNVCRHFLWLETEPLFVNLFCVFKMIFMQPLVLHGNLVLRMDVKPPNLNGLQSQFRKIKISHLVLYSYTIILMSFPIKFRLFYNSTYLRTFQKLVWYSQSHTQCSSSWSIKIIGIWRGPLPWLIPNYESKGIITCPHA